MKSISKFLPLVAAVSLSVVAVDEELQPGQSNQQNRFEELVVTSSRIEQPLRQVATAMTVITRDDLDLKGYSSVADALRTEASVGVSNAGGAGKATALRIRGEEGYRTLVMIDGVDMADPTGTQIGSQVQHLMNTLDIERIEVLRGPQGFMYGADAGGVVNIITRTGDEPVAVKLFSEVGGDSLMNLGASVSGGNDTLRFALSVTDNSTDGFNAHTDDNFLQDDDGSDNRTVHFKSGVKISENLSATLVYRDIDADYEYDRCYSGGYIHDCTGSSDQQSAKLTLDYVVSDYSHSLSYAQTNVDRELFDAGVSDYFTEGATDEWEYLGSYLFSGDQRLVFGTDYKEEQITTTGNESDRDQLGVFVEYQHSINDQLFLTGGVRHDDNSDFGTHDSYRFSGAYVQDFTEGRSLKYRATYGTGFRAPSLFEVAYNSGPDRWGTLLGLTLAEEQSAGYDLGVDYLMSNGGLLQFTYFDQKVEDEIFYSSFYDAATSNFSDGYIQDGGETSSKGVEIGVDQPLNSVLNLTLNYTYNDTDSSTGFTRSRRPEHLANLGLNISALNDRLSLLANLRISRDAFNEVYGVGLVALDDYEVLDLSTVYRFDQGLELFGRIQNLMDEDYQEVTGYNTQDRTLSAGVRYSF